MTATRAAVALCTLDSLRADLRALGVAGGMTLMVHASLNKVGYLVGGPGHSGLSPAGVNPAARDG